MTYASPALRRKPQEVSEHFIKLVHARIAEVSGWKYIFERIPAFKERAKPEPGSLPVYWRRISFPAKDLYTGCAIHNDFPVNEFCDGIDVLAKYYELSKTQTCKRFSQIFRDGSACSVN